MKRILLTLSLCMLTLGAMAQKKDWAAFGRYEKANKEVTVQPTAVFMGNSITEGWANKDPEFFKKNNLVGRGISGQTSSEMLVRFRRDVLDHNPKCVVIMAGTNDVAQNNGYIAPENTVGNIISICELAQAHGIKVILCSVTPCSHYMPIPDLDAGSRIVDLNRKLKEYADSDRNITWLDYFTPLANEENGFDKDQSYDGVHPVVTVYSTMEQLFVETVSKVLKTKNDYYVMPMEKAVEIKKQKDIEWEERMKRFKPRR